jgi:glyoxylase-like metal-dependent hydrolase (beta-lactamase superfamily II)
MRESVITMTAREASFSGLTLGGVRLAFVPDGSIRLPPVPLYDGGTSELFEASPHVLDAEGLLVMSLGSLLIESYGTRILVDLGWGPASADIPSRRPGGAQGRITGGHLLGNLACLGLRPEDIDMVVFSHLHADHVGWLVTETSSGPRLTFPRAEHRLAEAEWDYWTDPARGYRWGWPTPVQLELLGTRRSALEDGAVLAPGVNVMLTPGHTPGHASFVVSSGTERAIVLGDTIHCPVEISHPELALLSDVDPVAGRATRARLQRELDGGTVAVGGHFPDFVFGRVIKSADGRRLHDFSGWGTPGRQ